MDSEEIAKKVRKRNAVREKRVKKELKRQKKIQQLKNLRESRKIPNNSSFEVQDIDEVAEQIENFSGRNSAENKLSQSRSTEMRLRREVRMLKSQLETKANVEKNFEKKKKQLLSSERKISYSRKIIKS